ncbi:hypothetical protein ACHAXS_014088, partial [Conticribra weissflogii]
MDTRNTLRRYAVTNLLRHTLLLLVVEVLRSSNLFTCSFLRSSTFTPRLSAKPETKNKQKNLLPAAATPAN